MVVEAIANPRMIDDSDDDDTPIVFKRRDASRPHQSSPQVKGSSSAQSDKTSAKVPDPRTSSDHASCVPKGKVVQVSKPSSSKPPVIQKSSTLAGKVSPLKSPPHTSSSSLRGEDKKPSTLSGKVSPLKSPPHTSSSSLRSEDKKPSTLSSKVSPLTSPSHTSASSLRSEDKKPSTLAGKVSPLTSPPHTSTSSLRREDKKPSTLAGKISPLKSPPHTSNSSLRNEDKKPSTLAGKVPPLKSTPQASTSSLPNEDKKPSTLAGKVSQLKSTPQASTSSLRNEDKKVGTQKNATVKEEKPLASDSEDSEDDMPLSSRLSIKKNSTNGGSKEQGNSSKPLNGNSSDLSDDDKPLASKLQQNGFIKREDQVKKPLAVPAKRPAADSFPGQSSAKKPRPSSEISRDKAKVVSTKSDSDDENDHIPISQRMKKPTPSKKPEASKQKAIKVNPSSFKKDKKKIKKINNTSKYSKSSKLPPGSGEGQKWTTLVHSGVIFPPPYTPHRVKMLYDGKPVDLTPEQEEVATMYAVMLDTDYLQKPKFNENFFTDWKKLLGRNHVIQDLKKCDFTPIHQWHLREKEKKKQMTTEEKKAVKEEKLKQEEKYMWAIVDGVKEKVGNFRVEPPGLFRGRGEHPKMGKLKKRIRPSDITLNIGKGAPVPECPIPGERWKEVRNDNTVTWLAFWNDPINPKEFKYVFLAASSTLKGQSDKEKYEKARKLKDYIQGIRTAYTKDFSSKDMTKRQIAVATYLIDRLALRAGNEKDDDEADTVGCCTLKVENVKPIPPNILEFDFLGKDSIRYHKQFEAEPLVFKAVEQFRNGKKGGDDLFDMLDTSKLNAHLKELMPGLTAKVFRTYNASFTLDDMLGGEAEDGDVVHKVSRYQHANKEVAIICNHQRTVSKSHNAQMERLTEKITELKDALSELETDLSRAKKGKPPLKGADGKQKRNLAPEAIGKKIEQTKVKIDKMERDMRSKEDLKEIALGTSRINYLDPRITVAWCKRNEVPIEKLFNKSLLAKFAWAMDVDPSFRF